MLHSVTLSNATTQASGIIFVGFVIGSYGEVNFTTLGVVYGVLSSFFVALYGMYALWFPRYASHAYSLLTRSYVRKIIEVVDKDEQYARPSLDSTLKTHRISQTPHYL